MIQVEEKMEAALESRIIFGLSCSSQQCAVFDTCEWSSYLVALYIMCL